MTYDEIFSFNEIVGYTASIVIILSFLVFHDLKRVRVGNLFGALIFIGYGILIERIPIIILNTFIVLIQLYFLFIKKEKSEQGQ